MVHLVVIHQGLACFSTNLVGEKHISWSEPLTLCVYSISSASGLTLSLKNNSFSLFINYSSMNYCSIFTPFWLCAGVVV
jgi:hypothetical protein